MQSAKVYGVVCLCGLMWMSCASVPPYTSMSYSEHVSCHLDIREDLPVTAALVGGQEVSLVLDLGSSFPLKLPVEVLREANAMETGHRLTFRDAAGHKLSAREFIVPELTWGPMRWKDVRAIEQVWHPDYEPPLKLGVMGWRLFADVRMVMDLGRGELLVKPSRPCAESSSLVEIGQGVYMELWEGEGRHRVLLDTAATANIVTSRGEGTHMRTLHTSSTTLHPMPFEFVVLAGLPADMILGITFWTQHKVTLDMKSRCVEVSKNQRDTRLEP